MALAQNFNSQGTFPTGASPTIASTCAANDVLVIVLTYWANNAVGSPDFVYTTSMVDNRGRTWKCRKRTKFLSAYLGAGSTAGNNYITQETWWCDAGAASGSFTVTLAVANSANEGTNPQFMYSSYSGSLTQAAPWDTNASLPSVVTFGNNTTPGAITVSGTTSQANSLALGTISDQTSSAASTVPVANTGWTNVQQTTIGTSPNQYHCSVVDKAVASPGAVSNPFTTTKQSFIVMIDALSGTSTGTASGEDTTTIGQPQVVTMQ